jgi:sortase A
MEAEETNRRNRGRHRRRSNGNDGPWPWWRRAVLVFSVLAIIAGIAIGLNIVLFLHHSSTAGRAIVKADQRAIVRAQSSGQCTRPTTTTTAAADAPPVQAILTASKLGLIAPILQGTDDAELDVGVGHVPSSSWPASTGTDVLSAHDVTWFSHLDQLSAGDPLSITTPCVTYDYVVTRHEIVPRGAPVDQTIAPRLVLVTCYPLNALFLTPNRFIVYATLTKVVHQGEVALPPPAAAPLPTLAAPTPLLAQPLDLAHNQQLLGVLSTIGTPTSTWLQSSAPINAEALVLSLYFAALRTAGQDQPQWWTAIAPTVPFSDAQALVGARIVSTAVAVHPTLDVVGTSLTGATLTSSLVVADNRAPGTYAISLTAGVSGPNLVVTGFSLQRTS